MWWYLKTKKVISSQVFVIYNNIILGWICVISTQILHTDKSDSVLTVHSYIAFIYKVLIVSERQMEKKIASSRNKHLLLPDSTIVYTHNTTETGRILMDTKISLLVGMIKIEGQSSPS